MEAQQQDWLKEVMNLHEKVLAKYGGAAGIRDHDGLMSAVTRPLQSFGGQELYPDVIAKAAAFLESIITNHPFVDGNKRTGILGRMAFLLNNRYVVTATVNERYDFVIQIASGELGYDQILHWLKNNTKEI